MAIGDKVGNFTPCKDFDALLIDVSLYPTNRYQLPPILTQDKSPEELLLELIQKFVYVGDDRNILKVFVAGQQVK